MSEAPKLDILSYAVRYLACFIIKPGLLCQAEIPRALTQV